MTLPDMRLEFERVRSGWRSRPPAEHRFDLAALTTLRRQAEESTDDGTEQLIVEVEDLIAQIERSGPHQPRIPQSGYNEPSDSM